MPAFATAAHRGAELNASPRRSKGGRPSKGDRHLFQVRVPIDAAIFVIAEAERLGVNCSDYLGLLIVEHAGTDLPWYLEGIRDKAPPGVVGS